ncbi:MAG TPA: type IV toxin-antitoxin system AbiEi family antitoxin domain-containing protein [Acidimicrobiales bacterium]|nr:type IV toxin-antitoxin system AbiEi family antitoxin domain-containing protein [Acidimicrobiales bacterium]
MELDRGMRRLAEHQHGVVARGQARALGASRDQLRRRVESGDWENFTFSVLRLVGSLRTFRQRAMAASLDAGAGAAISHESAAALWRLPGFPSGPMHVSRPSGRSILATVHRTYVLENHVCLFERIPVTRPARTIFDLAGALHPHRTERALDNALARGLTSIGALHRVTEELAGQGRPGSALMRRLLADRAGAYVPPESNLEARLHAVAKRAGLELARQRNVGGDDWLGRVDFLDPERRLVVEVDSDLYHSALLDKAADAQRDAAMKEAGYTVVRINEHELWHRPDDVVRRLLAS